MDFTTLNLHELNAERNARYQLLQQSQGEAIAHLERVIGAMLLTMNGKNLAGVREELCQIENLDAETQSTVQLYGETSTDITVKSKRETWRDDIVALEKQIAILEAQGETDEP